MIEAGDNPRFFEVHVHAMGVRSAPPSRYLDGHLAVQDFVVSQVDPSEAPFPQNAVDSISSYSAGSGRCSIRLCFGEGASRRFRRVCRRADAHRQRSRLGDDPSDLVSQPRLQQGRQFGKPGNIVPDFRSETEVASTLKLANDQCEPSARVPFDPVQPLEVLFDGKPGALRQRRERSSAQTSTISAADAVWWASRNVNTSGGELDRAQALANFWARGWFADACGEESIRRDSLFVFRLGCAASATHQGVIFDYEVVLIMPVRDPKVDRVAKGLLALGIGKGDHVAVWATNWPNWLLLQFATARIGAVMVLINPAYRTHELAYVLKQSDAGAIFLIDSFRTSDYFGMLNQAVPELARSKPGQLNSADYPLLKHVVAMKPATARGMWSWEAFLQAGEAISDRELADREALPKATEPVNIQYYTRGRLASPRGPCSRTATCC